MIKGKIILYNKKKVLILVKTTYIHNGEQYKILILASVGVKRTNALARYINWLERVEMSKK